MIVPTKATKAGLASAIVAAIVAIASPALAHSASDAYLTLESAPPRNGDTVVKGQWEIALRDLDFALTLDDDGDGEITWGELRRHQRDIGRYAYERLRAGVDNKACELRATNQQVTQRADGAYAALSFEIVCSGNVRKVALDYRLFFSIDPSHRCILVIRNGTATSTALLSPEKSSVDVKL